MLNFPAFSWRCNIPAFTRNSHDADRQRSQGFLCINSFNHPEPSRLVIAATILILQMGQLRHREALPRVTQ